MPGAAVIAHRPCPAVSHEVRQAVGMRADLCTLHSPPRPLAARHGAARGLKAGVCACLALSRTSNHGQVRKGCVPSPLRAKRAARQAGAAQPSALAAWGGCSAGKDAHSVLHRRLKHPRGRMLAAATACHAPCLLLPRPDAIIALTWHPFVGTGSFGLRHTKSHTLCRRCGRRSFHVQKSTCGSCGYPAAKIRKCECRRRGRGRRQRRRRLQHRRAWQGGSVADQRSSRTGFSAAAAGTSA